MNLFFELIQVAIGRRKQLSECPTEEQWQEVYNVCQKQAMTGIGWYGIEHLPKEQRPNEELLFLWMGMAQKIVATNEVVIDAARKVTKKLHRDGFDCCILKGAGNIIYYNANDNVNDNSRNCIYEVLTEAAPRGGHRTSDVIRESASANGNSTLHSTPYTLHSETGLGMYRSAGDVDVWMIPREGQDVIKYATQAAKERGEKKPVVTYLHTNLPKYKGIEVEAHFRPAYMNSPIYNRRTMRWQEANAEEQMKNVCELGFPIPTAEFNVAYQLNHVFRHLIKTGVGLRQMLDYYMIVKAYKTEFHDKDAMPTLRYLGLDKFAAAMMYVMQKVFAMDNSMLLCKPDKDAGEILLKEIILAGNFGKHDDRRMSQKGLIPLALNILTHDFRIMRAFPLEIICDPFFRVYHKFWQLFH